jgi:hypothetical protein
MRAGNFNKTLTKKVIFPATALIYILAGGGFCQTPANANASASQTPVKNQNETADNAHEANVAGNELLELRKSNEKAQAEYYQKLSQKLDEKPPERTFGERFTKSLAESPASTIGIFSALLLLIGALITARITYLSFLFNYFTALRNQSDAQFFEALKRFGDKESSTARASAAGLLANISKMPLQTVDPEKFKFFTLLSSMQKLEKPYEDLAFDQLLAGTMLEEDATVLSMIQNAIRELFPLQKAVVAGKLYQINLNLQDNLTKTLAEYFGTREVAQRSSLTEPMLKEAEILTGIKTAELSELMEQFDRETESGQGIMGKKRPAGEFSARLRRAKEVAQGFTQEKKSESLKVLSQDLRQAGLRLKLNAELLLEAVEKHSDLETKYVDAYLSSYRHHE